MTMRRSVKIVGGATIVVLIWVLRNYMEMTATRQALIYHPETDVLYAATVSVEPVWLERWRLLLRGPVASDYSQIMFMSLVGKLTQLDSLANERRHLLRTNAELYLARVKKEADSLGELAKSNTRERPWPRHACTGLLLFRHDSGGVPSLPERWRNKYRQPEVAARDARLVDLIVVTRPDGEVVRAIALERAIVLWERALRNPVFLPYENFANDLWDSRCLPNEA
jgi:hypothetical protein